MKRIAWILLPLLLTACSSPIVAVPWPFAAPSPTPMASFEYLDTRDSRASASPGDPAVFFIQHVHREIGRCISGLCIDPRSQIFTFIDGPGYLWDQQKLQIEVQSGWSQFEFPPGSYTLLGYYTTLEGASGSGIASGLRVIEHFPFTDEGNNAPDCTIRQVETGGNALFTCGEQSFTLAPGQTCQKIHLERVQIGQAEYEVTHIESFVNEGYLRPNQLIGPKKSE